MKGINDLIFGIRGGFSLFYCQTYEVKKTAEEITATINEFQKADGSKPYSAVNYLFEVDDGDGPLEKLMDADPGTAFVAKNYHWYLMEAGEIVTMRARFFQDNSELFTKKSTRKVFIIVGVESFEEAIPDILQKDFTSVTFGLPEDKEIEETLDFIVKSAIDNIPNFRQPTSEERKQIVEYSRSLTSSALLATYSYAITKADGEYINPEFVFERKAEAISQTPGLSIGKYQDEDDLLGYDRAKKFALMTMNHSDALGIILMGPAGTGKTSFGKWLAAKSGRPVIIMEFAQMVGSGLYGQAEKELGRAKEVLKANPNSIVFIDELDKALPAKRGSGGDDATTRRAMSQFLKFLSDERPEGMYIIATCNSLNVDPEWVRAERWDCGPIFVDLPNEVEQAAILKYYQKKYKVKGKPTSMAGWSGAEIKSLCRLANMAREETKGDVSKMQEFIKPVSVTMKEEIRELRSWAKDCAVMASDILPNGDKKSLRSFD